MFPPALVSLTRARAFGRASKQMPGPGQDDNGRLRQRHPRLIVEVSVRGSVLSFNALQSTLSSVLATSVGRWRVRRSPQLALQRVQTA